MRLASRFSPGRMVVATFAITILIGSALLMLPVARTGADAWPLEAGLDQAHSIPATVGPQLSGGAPLSVALFTATSACSVTGLIVVDTSSYWTGFGQVVLLILMQIGGLGTMTIAALVAMALARRLGLRQRALTAASAGELNLGDVRDVVVRITVIALTCEITAAVILALRLAWRGEQWATAIGHGIFFAISAFNNAGFSPLANSLMPYATDGWIILPISALIIIGGLGFPVLVELRRRWRMPQRWSLNTRLVLLGTVMLTIIGWVVMAIAEWTNEATIGQFSTGGKLLASFFSALSPRTAGFNSVDIAAQHDVTWLTTDLLMFVGGGPAGTAGGIKITTALCIFYIVLTEVRGERAVNILGKRLDRNVHRQALTVVSLSAAAVLSGTVILMSVSVFGLDRSLYEAISAFSTVGLSTGITARLPLSAQFMLIIFMFVGRIGPLTVATALALKRGHRRYEYPKERPLIG
ncbi:MAG: potassium transporter TrkG [Bowdeniella nasicola]|nr:potassium transporter TrkG [Bowdeniella nasicola]